MHNPRQSAPDLQSNGAQFRQYAGISEQYPGHQAGKWLNASMLAHNRPAVVLDCRIVGSLTDRDQHKRNGMRLREQVSCATWLIWAVDGRLLVVCYANRMEA